MEHIFASAAVALVVSVGTLLLWLRVFQKTGLELEEARQAKRLRVREHKVEALLRQIEDGVSRLAPGIAPKITPSDDDDLDIFNEAKRRWEEKNRR